MRHLKRQRRAGALIFAAVLAVLAAGCGREPGSTNVTRGSLRLECDEAIEPVMRVQAEEFMRQYTDARVVFGKAEAREAVVDFANDSVRVIVCGRPFDNEEEKALADAKIQYQKFKVALSGVAVIVNERNPVKELRMGELDSMFSGAVTRWPAGLKKHPIDLVVGGLNSSTNEVFREKVLHGEGFSASATPVDSSRKVIEYVRKNPDAVGIVGLNWLQDYGEGVRVLALGTPGSRPDSTEPVGKFYLPEQFYLYKEYYPLSTPIYIYTREASLDLGVGFISYVSSLPGQRTFQKSNLVPVTIPVRWVQTSSRPLHTSSGQVQEE